MKKQSTETTTAKGPKPTHEIFLVVGEGERAIWTKIAAAWPHKDGKGLGGNCALGRIVVRPAKQNEEMAGGQQ